MEILDDVVRETGKQGSIDKIDQIGGQEKKENQKYWETLNLHWNL